MTTYFSFLVRCPELHIEAPWELELSGTAIEQSGGQYYFSPANTKVVSLKGEGLSPQTEASWGVGILSAIGPISAGVYNLPVATPGYLWFQGGATRSESEGPAEKFAAGTPFALTGGTGFLEVESNQSGRATKLSCASRIEGYVENPVGEGPGVSRVSLTLSKCAFGLKTETIGCTVQGGGFTTAALAGTVKLKESYPTIRFAPVGAGPVGEFTVSGCSIPALNHKYTITGGLNVKAQMSIEGSLGAWHIPQSLNALNSGSLAVLGQTASASGEVTAEVAGQVVTLG